MKREVGGGNHRGFGSFCPLTDAVWWYLLSQVGLADVQFLHDCTDKLHDEACIAHCGFGFEMQETQPSIFTCQNSILVGSGLPTCVGRPCNYSLPSGVGVSHNCYGKTTGQTCEASCGQAGYKYATNGNQQTFTCKASQIFEGTAPSCERITCTDLVLDNRFYHNCQNKRFGETCGVSCATGYHLSGWGSQLACSADGTYTGSVPNCKGNPCSNPLLSDATLVSDTCSGLTTGETCTVRCQEGFSPTSATMQCDATGFLLGTAPSCNPLVCETPSELTAASIAHTCNSVNYNRSCAVTCAAGYKLSSGAPQEWSCSLNASSPVGVSLIGSLPACEAEVCSSGLPAESERTVTNCTGLKTGETCKQECATGYAGSDGTFTCGSDGAARAPSTAQCQPVTCNLTVPDASAAAIGHICVDVAYGFSCSAYCKKGYSSTNGVQSLTCAGPESGSNPVDGVNDSITLRGSLPSCLAQACFYNFPSGSQFLHDCDGIRTGGQCTASCGDAWDGQSTTLTCEAEGALSGTFPVCILRTMTQTQTVTTTTSTMTDFEVRVNVAGVLRMEVNNSQEFVQDPDAKQMVGQVLGRLIGIGIEELQVSLIIPSETVGRLLASGGVTAVYSAWFLTETQRQADDLGSNITARLDEASVVVLQGMLVDALMNISEGKVAIYSIQVLAHNADITIGSRRQEAVSKLVTGTCSPSSFPVISGSAWSQTMSK